MVWGSAISWLFFWPGLCSGGHWTLMCFRLPIPPTTTSARCHSGRSICLHSSSCCSWECSVGLDLRRFPTSRWFFQFYISLCCQFGTSTLCRLSVFSQSTLSFINWVNCNRPVITNGENLTFVEYDQKLCFEKVQCGLKWFLIKASIDCLEQSLIAVCSEIVMTMI